MKVGTDEIIVSDDGGMGRAVHHHSLRPYRVGITPGAGTAGTVVDIAALDDNLAAPFENLDRPVVIDPLAIERRAAPVVIKVRRDAAEVIHLAVLDPDAR